MTSAAENPARWERIEESSPRDTGENVFKHVRERRPAAAGGYETRDRVLQCTPGWLQACTGRWSYLHAGGAAGVANIPVEFPDQMAAYRLPDPPAGVLELTGAACSSLMLLEELPLRAGAVLAGLAYRAAAGRPYAGGRAPAVTLTGPGQEKLAAGLAALHHFAPGVTGPPQVLALNGGCPGDPALQMARSARDVLLLADDPARDQCLLTVGGTGWPGRDRTLTVPVAPADLPAAAVLLDPAAAAGRAALTAAFAVWLASRPGRAIRRTGQITARQEQDWRHAGHDAAVAHVLAEQARGGLEEAGEAHAAARAAAPALPTPGPGDPLRGARTPVNTPAPQAKEAVARP